MRSTIPKSRHSGEIDKDIGRTRLSYSSDINEFRRDKFNIFSDPFNQANTKGNNLYRKSEW